MPASAWPPVAVDADPLCGVFRRWRIRRCLHLPHRARPGRAARRYGSAALVSTFASFAAAAIVTYALNRWLTAEQMATFGWRLPFLIAAPLGLVGLYLRWRLDETPAFKALAPSVPCMHRWARHCASRRAMLPGGVHLADRAVVLHVHHLP